MTETYEAVIGLEVHVELATQTKMFCECKNVFGSAPNTNVCPVCMGLPGALPVPNKRAVELAVATGLATRCKIAGETYFERKNYFYPDLPKAYQISQLENPVCFDGGIDIFDGTQKKRVGITRIQLEEDAGKLLHDAEKGTLIDFNRCGVPLIEIVTEPDIRSADEARAFLTELRTILMYLGVSDCKMNEGSFRCDVNLSVRKQGDDRMGVRTEMKNINSFAFVAKAIEYEFARQVAIVEAGNSVCAETRRFDSKSGQTYSMRSKESAADYRFFPEPDIPPFYVGDVSEIARSLPVLPAERRRIYREKYGIGAAEASVIASGKRLADFFEATAALTDFPRLAANILLTELLANSSAEDFETRLSPAQLAELASLYGEQKINSSTAKKLLSMINDECRSVEELVKKHSLYQINDAEYLAKLLSEVKEETPKLFEDYNSGKLAAKKAIVGKIMAKTGGRANPQTIEEVWGEFFSQR